MFAGVTSASSSRATEVPRSGSKREGVLRQPPGARNYTSRGLSTAARTFNPVISHPVAMQTRLSLDPPGRRYRQTFVVAVEQRNCSMPSTTMRTTMIIDRANPTAWPAGPNHCQIRYGRVTIWSIPLLSGLLRYGPK